MNPCSARVPVRRTHGGLSQCPTHYEITPGVRVLGCGTRSGVLFPSRRDDRVRSGCSFGLNTPPSAAEREFMSFDLLGEKICRARASYPRSPWMFRAAPGSCSNSVPPKGYPRRPNFRRENAEDATVRRHDNARRTRSQRLNGKPECLLLLFTVPCNDLTIIWRATARYIPAYNNAKQNRARSLLWRRSRWIQNVWHCSFCCSKGTKR